MTAPDTCTPTAEESRALLKPLTGYTRGPWGRECWDILGLGPGTGAVCEVGNPGVDDSEFWEDGEADNNARLIAAAPDLVDHLRAALDREDDALGRAENAESVRDAMLAAFIAAADRAEKAEAERDAARAAAKKLVKSAQRITKRRVSPATGGRLILESDVAALEQEVLKTRAALAQGSSA